MRNRHLKRSVALIAGAATALALTACAEDDDPDEPGATNGGDERQCDEPADPNAITIGAFSGWEEGIAATYIWKAALEEQGFRPGVQREPSDTIGSGRSS
jgi:glycine betaine/proline transport system substrate-binding protein